MTTESTVFGSLLASLQKAAVQREDIEAAIAYAADLARETVIPFMPRVG